VIHSARAKLSIFRGAPDFEKADIGGFQVGTTAYRAVVALGRQETNP
jgi:hypothetical protein